MSDDKHLKQAVLDELNWEPSVTMPPTSVPVLDRGAFAKTQARLGYRVKKLSASA